MSARACKGKSTAQPYLCTPCAAASQHAAAQSLCIIELSEADRNRASAATASDRRSDPCRIPARTTQPLICAASEAIPARKSASHGAASTPELHGVRSRQSATPGESGTTSPDTAQGVHNARRAPARPSPSKEALPLRSAPHNGGHRRRPPCRTVNAKMLSAGY